MIQLTRLDNSPILINLETIKYIESTPDTLIRFTNGDSVIVRETLGMVEQRVIELKSRILHCMPPTQNAAPQPPNIPTGSS